MITDRIEGHKVLLPINHSYNKFCDNLNVFKLAEHSLKGCGPLPFIEVSLKLLAGNKLSLEQTIHIY